MQWTRTPKMMSGLNQLWGWWWLVAAGAGRNECRVSGQPLVKTTLVASSGDLPFTEPLL